jgi:ketosteroid isomerase-like protein
MPPNLVDASERLWERFMAGDTPGVLALLDPEIEVREPPEMPDAGVYHGHQGWQTQLDRFGEAFTDLDYDRLECTPCGGDAVISVIHATGRATSSGIPGEMTYAQLENWRDGKVVLISYFSSKESALEAAGLRE